MSDIKDHKFMDSDISDVFINEFSAEAEIIELTLNPETEALVLSKDDISALAQHFGIIE